MVKFIIFACFWTLAFYWIIERILHCLGLDYLPPIDLSNFCVNLCELFTKDKEFIYMETPQHIPRDIEIRRKEWQDQRTAKLNQEREIDLSTFVRPKNSDMRDLSDMRELNDGREISLI